jgi:hypothetical protein
MIAKPHAQRVDLLLTLTSSASPLANEAPKAYLH